MSALFKASQKGHVDVVRQLLLHGGCTLGLEKVGTISDPVVFSVDSLKS